VSGAAEIRQRGGGKKRAYEYHEMARSCLRGRVGDDPERMKRGEEGGVAESERIVIGGNEALGFRRGGKRDFGQQREWEREIMQGSKRAASLQGPFTDANVGSSGG